MIYTSHKNCDFEDGFIVEFYHIHRDLSCKKGGTYEHMGI
jgi:hypothetical protein